MTYRKQLLDAASELVHGDRNRQYDEPSHNFDRIARMWSIYLATDIRPHDVAVLNMLQKVSRLMVSPDHFDSWADIAGYAACGWEARQVDWSDDDE